MRVQSRVRAKTESLFAKRPVERCRIGIRSLWIRTFGPRDSLGGHLHLRSRSRMWQVIVAISKHLMLAHLSQVNPQQVRSTISKPEH